MLNYQLVVIAILLLPIADVKAKERTSAPLAVKFVDKQPIPHHLVPTLKTSTDSSGLAGEILQFIIGEDSTQWYGQLTAMHKISDNEFITTAPISRQDLWLMIDHPGYLRMYRAKIPLSDDSGSTVILTLPERGQLRATLDLKTLRNDADTHERWQEALKSYCINSAVSHKEKFSYQAHYRHCLENWQFSINHLAPGSYSIFSTGRWCDSTSGPAGYGRELEFSILPNQATVFEIPLVTRREHYNNEGKVPTTSYHPLAIN